MTSTASLAPSTPTSRAPAPITLRDKFRLFDDLWQPRVVAEMNDYQFKIVRIEGEFVWHSHAETDETFLVLDGELRIDFADGAVVLRPGDLYVVPRGVTHRPVATQQTQLLLIEPRGVLNTGDQPGERTAQNDRWI